MFSEYSASHAQLQPSMGAMSGVMTSATLDMFGECIATHACLECYPVTLSGVPYLVHIRQVCILTFLNRATSCLVHHIRCTVDI
jgi:hypothetical protein